MFSASFAAVTALVLAGLVDAAVISSTTTSPKVPATTSFTSISPGTLDYSNPYDTVLFPDNIVPANATLASLCSARFLSDETLFEQTASVVTYTQTGYTYPAANDPSSIITVPTETDAYWPEQWTYTASPPCKIKANFSIVTIPRCAIK
jgi:hypothetical protein